MEAGTAREAFAAGSLGARACISGTGGRAGICIARARYGDVMPRTAGVAQLAFSTNENGAHEAGTAEPQRPRTQQPAESSQGPKSVDPQLRKHGSGCEDTRHARSHRREIHDARA